MKDLIVSQISNLDNITRSQWKRLETQSPHAHFFATLTWFELCLDVFQIKNYQILKVFEDKNLVAILPLVQSELFGMKTFTVAGGNYIDRIPLLWIGDSNVIIRSLFKKINGYERVLLAEIPEEIIDSILSIKDYAVRTASKNYYLPLVDDPYQFVNKKQKSKVKNKFIKNPEITHKTYFGDKNGLALAKEVDLQSAKKERGQATFTDKENDTFFQSLLKHAKKQFVVDVLLCKNSPIAYSIGIEYKHVYYALNTSYKYEYKKYIPGKLLLYKIIERLRKEKIQMLDFCRGDSVLKQEFTQLYKTQYDVLITKSPTTKLLWKKQAEVQDFILHTDWIYMAYCQIKKWRYKT